MKASELIALLERTIKQGDDRLVLIAVDNQAAAVEGAKFASLRSQGTVMLVTVLCDDRSWDTAFFPFLPDTKVVILD